MGACQSSSSLQDTLSSKQSNEDNERSVQNTLKNHSNHSTAKSHVVQEVSVTPDEKYNPNDPLLTLKCTRYNFLGMAVGHYRPYGATYNISQNQNVHMVTLNEDISSRKDDIFNQVSSKISHDLKAKMSNTAHKKTIDDAINSTKDETTGKIESYLKSVANKKFDQEQKVEVKYASPLRFTGECGDRTDPKIDQNVIIDVIAKNIVNMITSDIQKKITSQEYKGKLDIDTTGGDMACEEQIGIGVIGCLACLLCVYILYYLASNPGKLASAASAVASVSEAKTGLANAKTGLKQAQISDKLLKKGATQGDIQKLIGSIGIPESTGKVSLAEKIGTSLGDKALSIPEIQAMIASKVS